jgi:hypothetical protein
VAASDAQRSVGKSFDLESADAASADRGSIEDAGAASGGVGHLEDQGREGGRVCVYNVVIM